MKNFQVMIFNAVVLIALGIYGYTIPPNSPTALIAPGIGIVLLILAFPIKKDNSVVTIVGILRANTIIILMAVVTLLALVFYISDFITRKAEREKKI
ncbi:MAG: hypothetical protein NTU73_11840 [Ignavibacteriae bacterium]|nr:hypothetical protein [Ignavibacteriota bacterium]